jgi:glutaredoxin 3
MFTAVLEAVRITPNIQSLGYKTQSTSTMATVEIYSSPFCGFCHRAKQLFNDKDAAFKDINVMMNGDRKREMIDRSGGRYTVPQIFINYMHIGGCDELYALERAGELERLLNEDALAV